MAKKTKERREPPPMLPVGALVKDGDDAGVVIAAFRGASGDDFYVYALPTGELNGQFGGGLRLSPGGVQSGLPAVIDSDGRDPLWRLRRAVAGESELPPGQAGVVHMFLRMTPEQKQFMSRLLPLDLDLGVSAGGGSGRVEAPVRRRSVRKA